MGIESYDRMGLITTTGEQDLRNHGTRLVDDRANMGWSRKEEYHNERQA